MNPKEGGGARNPNETVLDGDFEGVYDSEFKEFLESIDSKTILDADGYIDETASLRRILPLINDNDRYADNGEIRRVRRLCDSLESKGLIYRSKKDRHFSLQDRESLIAEASYMYVIGKTFNTAENRVSVSGTIYRFIDMWGDNYRATRYKEVFPKIVNLSSKYFWGDFENTPLDEKLIFASKERIDEWIGKYKTKIESYIARRVQPMNYADIKATPDIGRVVEFVRLANSDPAMARKFSDLNFADFTMSEERFLEGLKIISAYMEKFNFKNLQELRRAIERTIGINLE